MEYNTNLSYNNIKNYINKFHCLNKKIRIMKNENNIEYIENIIKCEHFINIVYPKIIKLSTKKHINKTDADELYNLLKLYNLDK